MSKFVSKGCDSVGTLCVKHSGSKTVTCSDDLGYRIVIVLIIEFLYDWKIFIQAVTCPNSADTSDSLYMVGPPWIHKGWGTGNANSYVQL